jgi:hypothetical protein
MEVQQELSETNELNHTDNILDEPTSRKSILSLMSSSLILLSQGLRLKQIRYVFSEMLKFIATILETPMVVKSMANTLRGIAELIAYDNIGETMSDCMQAVGEGINHIPPPPEEDDIDIIDESPKQTSLLRFFIYNPVKDIAGYFLKHFIQLEKWITYHLRN